MRRFLVLSALLVPTVAAAGFMVPKSKGANPLTSGQPSIFSRPYSVSYASCVEDLPNEKIMVSVKGDDLCLEVHSILAVQGGGAAPQPKAGSFWLGNETVTTGELTLTPTIEQKTTCYDGSYNKWRLYVSTYTGCTANGGALTDSSTGLTVWQQTTMALAAGLGPRVKAGLVDFVFK